MESGQNYKWSKLNVVKIKSVNKYSTLIVAKIKSGQN